MAEVTEQEAREAAAMVSTAVDYFKRFGDDGSESALRMHDAATMAASVLSKWAIQDFARREAEQAEAERLLRDLMQVFDAADEERLKEVHERDAEAEKWKSEGDMYGWNFHKGVAAGCTTASIVFFRVKRSMEQQRDLLKALKGGA